MKKIKYSIVCEDDAQKLFIETIIDKMQISNDVEFVFDHAFYKQFKANSRKEVLLNFPQAIDQSSFLHKYLLDLVIIGIDFDDRPKQHFDKHYKELYDKLSDKGKAKAVILFPVQAIEHWLLFIKKKKENPMLAKSFATEIEKIDRKQAKLDIDTNRKTRDQTSIELLTYLNVEWLEHQSESFRAFYNKLQTFVNNHDK